jgi:hypothetical protein
MFRCEHTVEEKDDPMAETDGSQVGSQVFLEDPLIRQPDDIDKYYSIGCSDEEKATSLIECTHD